MGGLLNILFVGWSGFATYFSQPHFLPSSNEPQLNQEIVSSMQAQHPMVQDLFAKLSDVAGVNELIGEPLEHVGFGRVSDSANMLGLSILIERGEIPKKTLIVYDSGHGIPVAAFMMREYFDQYRIQTIFHLPTSLTNRDGVRSRILAQSAAWGEELRQLQKQHAQRGEPDILFLALEAHRKGYDGTYSHQIDVDRLPSSEQLRSAGIEQVIFMTEAHPNASDHVILQKQREDIASYLETLDLPVINMGNDCRRDTLCWDLIGKNAPYGKHGFL